MALLLTSCIAALAYICFVMGIAFLCCTRQHLALLRVSGGLSREISLGFLASGVFVFSPAGILPPIVPTSIGLGVIMGIFLLTLLMLRFEPVVGTIAMTAISAGLAPLCVGICLCAWIAYTSGFPGKPFDPAVFVTLPLWSVLEGWGRAGLAATASALLLFLSHAFPCLPGSPLAWNVLRLGVVQLVLFLLLPMTVWPTFLPNVPEHAVILCFIGNWIFVIVLARLLCIISRYMQKYTMLAWSLLLCGAGLCVIETLMAT